jgi:hypothetical protein
MIIERNEFRLKFGKAREAIALWKELMEAGKGMGDKVPMMRLLTDISGPSYTIVTEIFLNSINDVGPKNYIWMTNEKYQEVYHKFIPLCESSDRTYFRIEAEYNF